MKENEKRLLDGTLVGAWQSVAIRKPHYTMFVQAHYDLVDDALVFRYSKDGRNLNEDEVNSLGIGEQIPHIKERLSEFCAGVIHQEASAAYREVLEFEKARKMLRNGE